MRILFRLCFFVGVFWSPTAFAEAPYSYYQELQNASPDLFKIEVIDVKTEILENSSTMKRAHVLAKAKVLKVLRTNSQIQIGHTISIDYEYAYCMCPGQGPIPIVEKRKKYTAYLSNAKTDFFVPAARGESFIPEIRERHSSLAKIFQESITDSSRR